MISSYEQMQMITQLSNMYTYLERSGIGLRPSGIGYDHVYGILDDNTEALWCI